MNIQDIIFIIVLVLLIFLRNKALYVYAGLVCIVISIPLFYFWIFFTAQRLTYYAAAFFFIAAIFLLFENRKSK